MATDIITTIAGSGDDDWSDGIPATSAELFCPEEVALDLSGRATVALLTFVLSLIVFFVDNVYIADNNNRIRKLTVSTGIISIIAGYGEYGYGGDEGLAIEAEVAYVTGLAVDASGTTEPYQCLLFIC